ncbi:MAG: bifunctional diaminohydroxyphosphoribosylaminopyrimidine deaminase/5-amino-6-(5-phosphoribosylamino)uracil reductase RibD [Acidimicrobiia bacterium]
MRRAVDIPDGLGVEELMRAAIHEARSTYPHPNPRVGAIIVTPDHRVLSVGVHEGPGTPHAEADALDHLPEIGLARGATVIVSLEPCSHHGRTPPCADALIDAGVARVVVGATDPDPRVAGTGLARLEGAGIEVVSGVVAEEVVAADPGYFHHRRTGLPFVTLKVATTLDGQVAAVDGTSRWITGKEAREDVHRLRAEHDAIITGMGTVIADDPALTVRLEGYKGPQPVPVVLAGRRPLPSGAAIGDRDPLVFRAGSDGRVDIGAMLEELGARGIVSAMVEAGPTLAHSFLAAGAVDRIVWYLGGRLAGGVGLPAFDARFETIGDAIDISIQSVERVGGDVRIIADPRPGGR